jgi:hypothetical protein
MTGSGKLALSLALAFLALSFFPREALATPSAKLTYSRGPGAEVCPDEADLRKAVAARLGYDPFFPWAKKTIEADITRGKRGFHGEVKVIDAAGLVRGARSLDATSQDCADIVRALALAISIALDDLGVDEPDAKGSVPPAAAEPEPTPAPEPEPAPVVAAPTPPPSTAPPPSARPLVPAVWIAPVLSFGSAPAPAFGFHADFELRYGLAFVDLEVQADVPAAGGTSPEGQVRTFLVLGSIAPCVSWPKPFFGCALLSSGGFQETGIDLASPVTQSAPFLAAGGRIGVQVPLLTRYFLVAHGDAQGVLTRHTVQIDGMQAYSMPVLLGRIGVGAGVRF